MTAKVQTRRAHKCIEIWSPILESWLPLPLSIEASQEAIDAHIKAHGVLNNIHLF